MELLLARNPDPASSLPYLLRLPLDGGLVFRTRGTWPRTSALYCHPISTDQWPAEPEIVERVALRVCARRGAAIDVVCDRGREQRSQIVFTRARGREVVFWQSPRTRKQARPDVRVPTARAQGIEKLEIIVDAHERYPFRFAAQQVRTARRGLACGDYAISQDGRIVCAVERKSLDDLVSSLGSGRLRFALGELSGLPRAAVVVEQGYAGIFAQQHVRGATVADGLAELQIRYPAVPIVHCDSRKLAEEWTYRFLAAADAWARDEPAVQARIGQVGSSEPQALSGPSAPPPSSAELRAWARAHGMSVSDRGRVGRDVLAAWRAATDPAAGGVRLVPDEADQPSERAPRRAARQVVARYHEDELLVLLGRVREGFAQLDAGEIDAFDLDELIHWYKRSAQKLWSFCGQTGSQWLTTARTLEYWRERGEAAPDWWAEGEPRHRR